MGLLSQIGPIRVLIIPFAAWLVAQVLKVTIQSLRERRLNLHYLVRAGGMPSAHSTLVCALVTAAGIVYGVNSGIFAISVVLAAIVMYDAASVRQTVDRQSAVLSQLLLDFPKTQLEFGHRMGQLVGHTRFQVVVGAILGVLLAWWWA